MMSNELKESISLRMLVTYFYEKNSQRSLDRPTDSKMPTSNSHYQLCSFSLHYSAAMTSVTQSDWSSVTSWGSWGRECKWLKRAKDKLPDVVNRNWKGISADSAQGSINDLECEILDLPPNDSSLIYQSFCPLVHLNCVFRVIIISLAIFVHFF